MIRLFDEKTEFFFSFIIKDKISKDITILTPTNTWQAYNDWGGASFYKYNLNKKIKKTNVNILSLDRPNPCSSPFRKYGHLADQEIYFYEWITEKNYSYSTIDDLDLHNNYDLSKTKVLIINNHSEYWTEGMLNNLENYLSKGGNLINLSGNNIFWKSIISNNQIDNWYECALKNGAYGGKISGAGGGGFLTLIIDSKMESVKACLYFPS